MTFTLTAELLIGVVLPLRGSLNSFGFAVPVVVARVDETVGPVFVATRVDETVETARPLPNPFSARGD